jgi:hypothetical protein
MMKNEYKRYEGMNPYHKYKSFIYEIPDLQAFEEQATEMIEQTRKHNPNFQI